MTQDELDSEALDDTEALFDWGCVRLAAGQVLQLRKAFNDFEQALAPYGELEQLTIDGVELLALAQSAAALEQAFHRIPLPTRGLNFHDRKDFGHRLNGPIVVDCSGLSGVLWSSRALFRKLSRRAWRQRRNRMECLPYSLAALTIEMRHARTALNRAVAGKPALVAFGVRLPARQTVGQARQIQRALDDFEHELAPYHLEKMTIRQAARLLHVLDDFEQALREVAPECQVWNWNRMEDGLRERFDRDLPDDMLRIDCARVEEIITKARLLLGTFPEEVVSSRRSELLQRRRVLAVRLPRAIQEVRFEIQRRPRRQPR